MYDNTDFCSEKRIRASLEKLVKSRQTSAQGRLDGFFKVVEKRPVSNYLFWASLLYSFVG